MREVLVPKKQPGKYRPLGIPCIRDRVTQTSALLVLVPIIEADLEPEQYAYRPEHSANDAVKRVHGLLNTGYNEVVDCDLSNYFGEIPHAELMKSLARRVSDGRMLGLIKAWLEMPVEGDDGEGGKRRTNRARRGRRGTPQGAPVSPVLSNLYMRRFILGWKKLGYARRFCAEVVNYADDVCVLGKAPAAEMHNSAGVVIDAVRCAKLGLVCGLSGPLEAPSAYYMKSPPRQVRDDAALRALESFLGSDGGSPTLAWDSDPTQAPMNPAREVSV